MGLFNMKDISGRVGNLVYRKVNGKTVVSVRPETFQVPMDPASIARRLKFGTVAKLTKAIKSLPSVEYCWKRFSSSKKLVHHQLISENFHFLKEDGLPDMIKMLPDYEGFNLSINHVSLTPEDLQVEITELPSNASIIPSVETRVQMIGIIMLTDPVKEENEKFAFITLPPCIRNTVLNTPIEFTLPLTNQDSLKYSEYTTRKAFAALVTLDSGDRVIHYSQTFSS